MHKFLRFSLFGTELYRTIALYEANTASNR